MQAVAIIQRMSGSNSGITPLITREIFPSHCILFSLPSASWPLKETQLSWVVSEQIARHAEFGNETTLGFGLVGFLKIVCMEGN